jgi:hypothetical protein
MVDTLETIRADLGRLRSSIKREPGKAISKKSLRGKAAAIAARWFASVVPTLTNEFGIPADVVNRYSQGFRRLIRISAPNNLKSSYEETLANLLRHFRDELILPVQTRPAEVEEATALDTILAGLPDPEEDAYLKEAIECARHKLYRGAVVLGWSAAVDRIHRTIAKIGFEGFNATSQQMTSQQKGRFKKFNTPQHVNSLSEVREVFDKIVLWIIEGMQLIDLNQHVRLTSCFDLRCQCAHPGDAPVTEFNLLSFFSDLNEIVFRNPTFEAPREADLEPPSLVIVPVPIVAVTPPPSSSS